MEARTEDIQGPSLEQLGEIATRLFQSGNETDTVDYARQSLIVIESRIIIRDMKKLNTQLESPRMQLLTGSSKASPCSLRWLVAEACG